MRTSTKTLLWGGVATAVLGPALVAGVTISTLGGVGTFAGILTGDGLPALTGGFQNYTPGQHEGLFGNDAWGDGKIDGKNDTSQDTVVP